MTTATSSTGIDLSRLSDHRLMRLRDNWKRLFGRYFTMDKTIQAAIAEIDAEILKRREHSSNSNGN